MQDNTLIVLFGVIFCVFPAIYFIKLAIKAKNPKEALKYSGWALFVFFLAGILGYVIYDDAKKSQIINNSIETFNNTKDSTKSIAILDAYFPSEVHTVIKKIIEKSAPGTEPLIIAILEKYGDKYIADKLLNSNNSKLQEAASNWASRHGYVIEKRTTISKYPKWRR